MNAVGAALPDSLADEEPSEPAPVVCEPLEPEPRVVVSLESEVMMARVRVEVVLAVPLEVELEGMMVPVLFEVLLLPTTPVTIGGTR